jgi:hypothetical protein
MNYMDFDPHLTRERHQQTLREIDSLRLKKRLWDKGGSSGSRLVALAGRSVMSLLLSLNPGGAFNSSPSLLGKDTK